MRKAGREEDENQGFLRDPAALSTHTHTHTHTCAHTQVNTHAQSHTRAVQKRGSFLSGAGVKNACQCRGHEFIPWSGKTPRAPEQLSPRAMNDGACTPEPANRNW